MENFNWTPMVLITIIWIMRCCGILSILQTLLSEIYPTNIRALAIGITQSCFMGTATLSTKFFPELKNVMGLHGVLFLYAALCLLNFFWGLMTIPDNRGKSLVKVEEMFGNTEKIEDQLDTVNCVNQKLVDMNETKDCDKDVDI